MQPSNFANIADALQKTADQLPASLLDVVEATAQEFGKSWSGSWLGYQARVYYDGFQSVPAGARFSKEWGLMDRLGIQDTVGAWREYTFEDVENEIYRKAKLSDLSKEEALIPSARDLFEESQARILSLLSAASKSLGDDKYLKDLTTSVGERNILSESDVLDLLRPRGQQISRDSVAITAGLHTPPHIAVIAKVAAIRSPFISCGELAKLARRASEHLENVGPLQPMRTDKKVFIGHGRSRLWRELKDFVQDRLGLAWEEFNREPVAGVTTTARLKQMLDESSIALLVMTAEDERADGSRQARMNVIHEIGLFQGRLGFEKAIVLLEDGCEEFSNIHGLGQIHFSRGNISATFEEIRRTMEREKLVQVTRRRT